ncbi:hypothetical protein BJ912DRAFT_1149528 [Pholiota molesta]|nr:hypothetical protein BJ912DRAFT_1149528 [Pholiota molesta]
MSVDLPLNAPLASESKPATHPRTESHAISNAHRAPCPPWFMEELLRNFVRDADWTRNVRAATRYMSRALTRLGKPKSRFPARTRNKLSRGLYYSGLSCAALQSPGGSDEGYRWPDDGYRSTPTKSAPQASPTFYKRLELTPGLVDLSGWFRLGRIPPLLDHPPSSTTNRHLSSFNQRSPMSVFPTLSLKPSFALALARHRLPQQPIRPRASGD